MSSLRDPLNRSKPNSVALACSMALLIGVMIVTAGGASAAQDAVDPASGPPMRIAQNDSPPDSVSGTWTLLGLGLPVGLGGLGGPPSAVSMTIALGKGRQSMTGRLAGKVEPVGSAGVIFTDVPLAAGSATFRSGRYDYDPRSGYLQLSIEFTKNDRGVGYSMSVHGVINSTTRTDAGSWTFDLTTVEGNQVLAAGHISLEREAGGPRQAPRPDEP